MWNISFKVKNINFSKQMEKYVSATVDVKRDLMLLAYHKWPNSVVCLAEKTVFSKHIVKTYSLIQQILI